MCYLRVRIGYDAVAVSVERLMHAVAHAAAQRAMRPFKAAVVRLRRVVMALRIITCSVGLLAALLPKPPPIPSYQTKHLILRHAHGRHFFIFIVF